MSLDTFGKAAKSEDVKTKLANLPPVAIRRIDNGFFHIADKTAGKLAKESAHGRLPRHGYEIDVMLPDGRKAILQRTWVQSFTWAPKRGWVWAIYAIRPFPQERE